MCDDDSVLTEGCNSLYELVALPIKLERFAVDCLTGNESVYFDEGTQMHTDLAQPLRNTRQTSGSFGKGDEPHPFGSRPMT